MLYRVTKDPVNNQKIFPNILVLGQWYIEYDNDVVLDYKNAGTPDEYVQFQLPEYSLWQHFWNPNTQTLDNYNKNKDADFIQLSPFTICKFYPNGTNDFEEMYLDTYVPPDTGSNLTIEEAAYEINKCLTESMIDETTKGTHYELYITEGYDTGVLHSIVNKNNLPVSIRDDAKHLHWPGAEYHKFCGPQQRFLKQYAEECYQLPPQPKNLIAGFMGGLEVVRWPNSLMGLFKFYDIDWHKELKKALKNETYLANFLNMDKWDWQTPDVNSIEEAKEYASNVLLHTSEMWSIDGMNLFVPYRNRDIHHWVLALEPQALLKHAFESSLHEEMIKQNDPEVLKGIRSPKINISKENSK